MDALDVRAVKGELVREADKGELVRERAVKDPGEPCKDNAVAPDVRAVKGELVREVLKDPDEPSSGIIRDEE